jgi:hypothetical protein
MGVGSAHADFTAQQRAPNCCLHLRAGQPCTLILCDKDGFDSMENETKKIG